MIVWGVTCAHECKCLPKPGSRGVDYRWIVNSPPAPRLGAGNQTEGLWKGSKHAQLLNYFLHFQIEYFSNVYMHSTQVTTQICEAVSVEA